jgi:hypothetical protein
MPTGPVLRGGLESLERINNFIKPLRAVGGIGGGIGGYLTGEEDEPGERILHTMGGAALGGGVIPGMIRTAKMAKDMPEAIVNGLYYSYLSSPDTIIRANLGAAGGALMHGLESLLSLDFDNAAKTFGASARAANKWYDSLVGSPEQVRALRHEIQGPFAEGRLDIPDERFRDVGLGKWFTAGDNAGVYAMTQGGLPIEEAQRYTLTGVPESAWGKSLVGLQSQWLRSDNPAQRIAAATIAPFARVGVLGLEQGFKRIPGIGMLKMFGGPGVKETLTPGSPAGKLARGRQILGGGMMYGGATAETELDPRLGLTMATGAGPAYLPYTIGREFKRQLQRTPDTPAGLMAASAGAAGEAMMEFSPLGYQPLGFVKRGLDELPRRAIPAGMADVASALDPAYGRKQGRAELANLATRGEVPSWMEYPMVGSAMARTPGLRERLPEEFAPVDIFGKPRLPSPEVIPGAETTPWIRGLSRVLAPARRSVLPPPQNLEDPMMRQLYDLGIRPSPPSQRVTTPGLGGPITMPAQTVAQVQRHRGQARERTAQILSQMAPWLMSLPPQQRAIMTSYLNNYINQIQGRATQAGSLALALSGGGQLPQM